MAALIPPTATFFAQRAMAATTDHIATGVAVRTMEQGGSAADAAVAAGAVMAVIAPYACGLGGDMFALVHEAGQDAPEALVAAGRSGSGIDADALRAEGHRVLPMRGDLRSSTVPGAVDGWLGLHARFGRLSLAEVLAPAVELAAGGFSVSPVLALALWQLDQTLPGGRPAWIPGDLGRAGLQVGARIRRPGVAATLEAIASRGREAFYDGPFGRGLVAMGQGLYTSADLAAPQARWCAPVGVQAWGHQIWSAPPPSQGYLIPLTAAIASRLELPSDPDDPGWAHALVEATIAAGHDRPRLLFDGAEVGSLLEEDAIDARAALVGERHSPRALAAMPGDTTQICVIDQDRLGVSLIQSNAANFGTVLFEPTTGIEVHNRGVGFSLAPDSPAALRPGVRPPHTLSPAMVTRSGELRATLGAAGGDAQPHVVVQLLARLLQASQAPGDALGAARFRLGSPTGNGFDTWTTPDGTTVLIEEGAPEAWSAGLTERGHECRTLAVPDAYAGHGHILEVLEDGGLAGAAEPRALTGAVAGC